MNAAVRYYSRSGNTAAVAKAIASKCKVWAVSVDQENAPIEEPVDVLFIGGALYAYGLDKHLKEYIQTLDKEKIGKAVVFSTSWLSKHALDLIKKELAAKGIPVEEETFYAKGKPGEKQLEAAGAFAAKFWKKEDVEQ